MRLLAWMLIGCFTLTSFAWAESIGVSRASGNALLKAASEAFSEGKFQTTVEELKSVESKLLSNSEANKQTLGLISYWKGICFNRLQEFDEAIASFDRSLGLDYAPVDIHYEYGQALFAAEKLGEARLQFRESLKRKFKRGVSLYYIGYISKEMGDKKKAFTFFKSINKLNQDEMEEVRQAAEMQIGDIYLEQIEKRTDAHKTVESYVIPQYQKALEVDPDSKLAPLIQEKIVKLQRRYDLMLFQLQNGRPTLNPPYLLRLSQEFGQDSNVTFAPAETTISASKQASLYSKTDVIGRYTFYYRDFLSISPEFRFNNTYYFNRVPEIYRNDNFLLAPALRTAHEHSLWSRPAAFLFDYEFNEARRDVNAKEKLEFSSRSHGLSIGEKFNYFAFGESVVRLRYRMLESFLDDSDSNMTSLVFEQVKSLTTNILLFYFSYDRMRVTDSSFDTDAFTLRTDFIMSPIRNWFTPSFGLAMTSTDPINSRATRGRELLLNPSARITKTFKRKWRAHLKYDYQKNDSKDKENFAFTKTVYALELEYLF
jgi:tetratricopeptide (TPR) repeat protein